MPEQRFYDPNTSAEVVSLHWDTALTSVDIAFGGSLLTKITDFAQLRGAGLAGAAPTGESIAIRLTANDSFDVSRNGEWLVPGEVLGEVLGSENSGTSTLLADATNSNQALSLDANGHLVRDGKRVDEQSLGITRTGRDSYAAAPLSPAQRARVWLLWFAVAKSVITVMFGLFCLTVFGASTGSTGADGIDRIEIPLFALFRGIALVSLAVGAALTVGVWMLWRMAGSYGARRAFTISKWISAAYLALTVIGTLREVARGNYGTLIGALIFGSIAGAAFISFNKAQISPSQPLEV
jgi:hypothetical protein